jgi:hypothetical protein
MIAWPRMCISSICTCSRQVVLGPCTCSWQVVLGPCTCSWHGTWPSNERLPRVTYKLLAFIGDHTYQGRGHEHDYEPFMCGLATHLHLPCTCTTSLLPTHLVHCCCKDGFVLTLVLVCHRFHKRHHYELGVVWSAYLRPDLQ